MSVRKLKRMEVLVFEEFMCMCLLIDRVIGVYFSFLLYELNVEFSFQGRSECKAQVLPSG